MRNSFVPSLIGIVVGLVLISNSNSNAYRILGLFPLPIRSHYTFYETLLVELSKRGHEVDVLTHFPRHDGKIKGYKELSVAGSMPQLENNVSVANSQDFPSIIGVVLEFINLGNEACSSVLSHPMVEQLKKAEVKYDVVITEMFATDCLLPYAHIYKAPIIGISSSGIMPWVDERMGNPDNPAYISNYFTARRGKLSFLEKVESTIMNLASKVWYHVLMTLPSEIHGRKVFGDMPPIENIAQNTQLLFANRHFTLDDPRPLVPGVIEVGGMHIRPAQTIESKDILKFIENAKHGVIYFSMGSLINMKTFSKQTLTDIIKAFATLEQKVIMKLNPDDIPDMKVPSNVMVRNFLPQIDILCHPSTKAFVTHGGTLSIQEAAYCGVPILGIPFYPYHEVNIQNYISKRAGIQLDYADINEVTLKANIDALLMNSTYRVNAQRLSALFKDRPSTPLDTAVYWTEYVLTHGGKHIRSLAADMIIFEYLLVDIVLVGTLLALIAFYVFYLVLQFLQELFDRPPPPKEQKDKGKEKDKDN